MGSEVLGFDAPVTGQVSADNPRVVRLNAQAVNRLFMIRDQLDDAALAALVELLMCHEPLFVRLLSGAGPEGADYAYRGGLFVHSVDVALRLFGSQGLPLEDKALAVAAGLVRDLGGAGDADSPVDSILGTVFKLLKAKEPMFAYELGTVLAGYRHHNTEVELSKRYARIIGELFHADFMSRMQDWGVGSRSEPGRWDH